MKFSQNNFLTAAKGIVMGGNATLEVTDGGYLVDRPVSPDALGVSGATRGASTNSLIANTVIFDADNEKAILTFEVPRDYDEAEDKLFIDFNYRIETQGSANATLQISNVVKFNAVKGEVPAALSGFSADSAVEVSSTNGARLTDNLSGLGLERGDVLNVTLNGAVLTGPTNVAHILGANVRYRSTLVSYNESDSSGAALR